jgi:OOP family OmpA-OmpF porin
VDRGIEHTRLVTMGYGPEQPIADNATPDGRAKNRRIEFELLTNPIVEGAPKQDEASTPAESTDSAPKQDEASTPADATDSAPE